jgi:hypothetical protein
MVVRACGHEQEFQHYSVDKYRAERLAKFQKTRCAACVAKLAEDEKRAAEAAPNKAEALKRLPPGTKISLTRQPDGVWAGELSVDRIVVSKAGVAGEGPQSVIASLARLWILKQGELSAREGRER